MTTRKLSTGSLGLAHYIFLAVLLVRLVALVQLTGSPFLLPTRGDMHFYNDWAQRIMQGQLTDYRAFYGLPLYAYVLAFLYSIFGYSPFVPAFIQAMLDAGTAALLFKICERVFAGASQHQVDSATTPRLLPLPRERVIGLLAAAGWALFVPAQAYSVILMPTAWLIFVFWFLLWQIVKVDHVPRAGVWLLYGLLVGVTATGVATILFLLPLLLAALILRPANTAASARGGMTKAAAVLMLVFGVAAGTAPCWIHNYFVARDPVFLSAHSGVNFWIGNNPIANGYPRFPPGLRAGQAAMLQDSITVAEAAAGGPLPRSAVSAFWSAKAKNYIRENFGKWLGLMTLKLRQFWNAFQYDDLSIITNLREHGVILPGPRFGIVAAFGLVGMLIAVVGTPRSRWIAAAVLLHMASLLTVFVTERYRLAAVPGLMLFAAYGLYTGWERLCRGQWRAAGIYGALVAAATLFVSIPQTSPGLWALDAYNAGWQALETGNLPLAERKLQLAHAYMPENAETNFALGNLRLEQGDRAAATRLYEATLQLEPQHKRALNNLGVLTLEAGDPAAAERYFRIALEQEPQNAKTHYLLARVLHTMGQAPRAAQHIQHAIAVGGERAEFLTLRDEIGSQMRDPSALKEPPP